MSNEKQPQNQHVAQEDHESLQNCSEPSHQDTAGHWNSSISNTLRIAATYWCFILLGANDSLYGVSVLQAVVLYFSLTIPGSHSTGMFLPLLGKVLLLMEMQLESFYHLNYTTVSLLFISPVAGFITSTLANHSVHERFGQRGIALIGGSCHIVAYAIASIHPPFPALVIVYNLVGLGSGTKQAAWNSYVGGMQNPNELLGLLHGFYGAGATIMPSVASSLFTKRGWQWYMIYYPLLGLAALDMAFSLCTFANQGGRSYREKNEIRPREHPQQPVPSPEQRRNVFSRCFISIKRSQTALCLRQKVVFLGSAFLLSYVGSEVAIGGWMVTFLTKTRHGTTFASGIATSGFWAGLTVGRFVLGFATARLFKSVKLAVSCYLGLSIVMQLLFWLIPNFIASAISAAFLGKLDRICKGSCVNEWLRVLSWPDVSECYCLSYYSSSKVIASACGRHLLGNWIIRDIYCAFCCWGDRTGKGRASLTTHHLRMSSPMPAHLVLPS